MLTLGHSAGGHLAVWAAGRQRLAPWSGARVRVTGAVPQAGVLDLTAASAAGLGGGTQDLSANTQDFGAPLGGGYDDGGAGGGDDFAGDMDGGDDSDWA